MANEREIVSDEGIVADPEIWSGESSEASKAEPGAAEGEAAEADCPVRMQAPCCARRSGRRTRMPDAFERS
jgi:hypothetical protein